MVLDIMAIIVRFGEILIAPIKDFEMLWTIVPIYLSGIIADYFQEKKGTSLGNAVSNGFVALWVGIDWGKQLTSKIDISNIQFINIVQAILCVVLIIYGFLVIYEGVKGRKVTHYLGRIRIITYLLICLTPVFYGVVPVELETALAILMFLPIWYLIFAIIMKFAPNPASIEEEEGAAMGGEELGGMEEMPGMEEAGPTTPPEQPQYPQQRYPPQYPPGYPQQGYPPTYPY